MVLPWDPNTANDLGCGYGLKTASHTFKGMRECRRKGMMPLLHEFAARLALSAIRGLWDQYKSFSNTSE